MRASTRKRIEALEATATNLGGVVPVITVELDERGLATDPIFVEHDGHRWTQADGESSEAFKERAKVEALKLFKPISGNHVLTLVFQRPRLTLEKWRSKHGLETPPADLLPGNGADD
ncbi:MAG: hypothetical protein KBC73_13160 [Burkholderiaceae bacterium]|nr:hypothetical protein [Burkholderiaceae bacterium]